MSHRGFLIAVLATLALPTFALAPANAEAGVAGFNSVCKKDLRNVKRQGGWKAFAVSNIYLVSKREFQSCGGAWNYSVKKNAADVAMIECRSAMKRARAPKSARCRVTLQSK